MALLKFLIFFLILLDMQPPPPPFESSSPLPSFSSSSILCSILDSELGDEGATPLPQDYSFESLEKSAMQAKVRDMWLRDRSEAAVDLNVASCGTAGDMKDLYGVRASVR